MITIDGSHGEGGGQILRTAISLSTITGKPVEVVGIRAKRPNPGIRPQHMAAIKIIADLFHARVENLDVGKEWIRFVPTDKFEGGSVKIDVGTAGSIPLILLTVMPAVSLSNNSLSIELIGGTDVKTSPTTDYVRHIVANAYRSIGIKFSIEVQKRGYYPKGGGIVQAIIESCKTPGTVDLLNSREGLEPKIMSVSSRLPKHVAERQTASAIVALEKKGIRCKEYTAALETSLSPGSSILVYAVSDFGPFIGGDSIGEPGKRAESVGTESANRFLESSFGYADVDQFLADMLVIPLALAKGRSKFKVARVTEHLRTNLHVASLITGCKYAIAQDDNNNKNSNYGYVVTIEN